MEKKKIRSDRDSETTDGIATCRSSTQNLGNETVWKNDEYSIVQRQNGLDIMREHEWKGGEYKIVCESRSAEWRCCGCQRELFSVRDVSPIASWVSREIMYSFKMA